MHEILGPILGAAGIVGAGIAWLEAKTKPNFEDIGRGCGNPDCKCDPAIGCKCERPCSCGK